SSYIDRFMSVNDSEPDIIFLIENLKNIIIKKLSVSCVTESFIFSLISSVTSFSAALFSVSFSVTSQSSTLASVSDSLTLTISVSATLTSATSGFTVSAFIISSSHFKKMLCRLDESCFSRIISLFNSVEIAKDICVFENRNTDVILFYTYKCEA
ncbi:hypothetical protein BDFG_09379, partial [Blastomyces dermatitidis ATCC 26199]